MSAHASETLDAWQAKLEAEFTPTIDSTLIAALLHEPGQTFEGAHAILVGLAGDQAEHDQSVLQAATSTPIASSNATTADTEDVERALAEWQLMDKDGLDTANLCLTDEDGNDCLQVEAGEIREAVRIGDAVGQGALPVDKVASGQEDVVSLEQNSFGGIDFLVHAFPARTQTFLQETLDAESGDVLRAIDTLTSLELIDRLAFEEEDNVTQHTKQRQSKMTNDDKNLANGSQKKKVTKRDRQRRKEQQAHPSNARSKVNLTDVRQGGSSARITSGKQHVVRSDVQEDEDDAAFAARLAREERIAAGLAPSDEEGSDDAVRDNDWLFASSVLEQLGLLLDIPLHKVKAVHASCHMNLRATFHRLVRLQCDQIPSLTLLDEHLEHAAGTASTQAMEICTLLPSKPREVIEQYLCAVKGSEDAVLDLAQMADRIEESAAGERTDVLDPMKMDRRATAEVDAPTSSIQAGKGAKEFTFVGTDADSLVHSGTKPITPYASAAERQRGDGGANIDTQSRQYALQRLRDGASSVTFPLNSAASSNEQQDGQQVLGRINAASAASTGGSGMEGLTATQAARLAHEYAAIAQEYRQRRQDYLSKAANSYRLTHNASTSKGPMRGAAAWVYADEARRLDAKARAFSLQSAQAMVQYRKMVNRSSGAGGSSSNNMSGTLSVERHGGDIVDLHGLTVHEALTITRQTLDTWWRNARIGSATTTTSHPLHLITGVGRHSRGNVALVRPAILAMLQRERWTCREPQQGHILVVGRK